MSGHAGQAMLGGKMNRAVWQYKFLWEGMLLAALRSRTRGPGNSVPRIIILVNVAGYRLFEWEHLGIEICDISHISQRTFFNVQF